MRNMMAVAQGSFAQIRLLSVRAHNNDDGSRTHWSHSQKQHAKADFQAAESVRSSVSKMIENDEHFSFDHA